MNVTVIDSGVANLASVIASLRRLDLEPVVTDDPADVRSAERVVLPGVGSFAAAMERLTAAGLVEAVREVGNSGRPILAVCLGMQLLGTGSDEAPGVAGIGLFDARFERLPDSVTVPHLGWNTVEPGASCRILQPGAAAFANSYALRAAPGGWAPAYTWHGSAFVSAVERGNILACQFHPELSGEWGVSLIRRWAFGSRGSVEAAPEPLRGARKRVIPCLDVRDGRVVKGVQFQSLRDIGDPALLAEEYEAQGADEIVVLDISASPTGSRTRLDTVRAVRERLSIPLTVGGGVRSVDDARSLLAAGADKVSVNTAAAREPELLGALADQFGRQCVVLAIDARRTGQNGANGQDYEVLLVGGREASALDAVGWAEQGASLGAGEILLTSWDRDGTRAGHDLQLMRAVSNSVRIPVIASGGIGSSADAADAFRAGADAVLAASILHGGDTTVASLKRDLIHYGIPTRT